MNPLFSKWPGQSQHPQIMETVRTENCLVRLGLVLI